MAEKDQIVWPTEQLSQALLGPVRTGVPLREVLAKAGVDQVSQDAWMLAYELADPTAKDVPFSVPWWRKQEAHERQARRYEAVLHQSQRRQRVECGARCRSDGHPFRNTPEPGRTRFKWHGGMSTGPRTVEGRRRIAEAQRRRWEEWRAARKAGVGEPA